jgi:RimJ/RimL family protein N-acetyltransferase
LYAPENEGDLNLTIQRHICALLENGNLREMITRKSMQVVNGSGVSRVIANMGMCDIEIRQARMEDSKEIFRWRNHPGIREVSRNKSVIDWNNHQSWLASVLADPNRMLLIGYLSESRVGVVRFDKQNDEVEISIYVDPEKTSSGLGQNLLLSAEHWLRANHPDIRRICANVLGTNEQSQRLFSGAGYQIESTNYSKDLH